MEKITSIDSYIAQFPAAIQERLVAIRTALKQAIPEGDEVISYNMPAIKTSKVLVYYAANKKHIGYYPHSEPILHFADELQQYVTSKGAIQFPYSKALPIELIVKIAVYNLEKE